MQCKPFKSKFRIIEKKTDALFMPFNEGIWTFWGNICGDLLNQIMLYREGNNHCCSGKLI